MQRSFEPEILDGEGVPPEVVERAHRGLLLTHTLLGNRAAILRALRRDGPPDPPPARRGLRPWRHARRHPRRASRST